MPSSHIILLTALWYRVAVAVAVFNRGGIETPGAGVLAHAFPILEDAFLQECEEVCRNNCNS